MLPSFCSTKMYKSRCVALSSEQKGIEVVGVFYFNLRLDLKRWYLEVLVTFQFLKHSFLTVGGNF